MAVNKKKLIVMLAVLLSFISIKIFVDNKLDSVTADIDRTIESIYKTQLEKTLESADEPELEIVHGIAISRIEDLLHIDLKKIVFIFNKNGREIYVVVDNWMSNSNLHKYDIRFFDEDRNVTVFH